MTLTIRMMLQRDYCHVVTTEAECFADAWCFEELRAFDNANGSQCKVVEIGGQVVGHMLYELHKHHLHLVRIAVAPRYMRCGIGRAMLAKLESRLSEQRRNRVTTRVAGQLLEAQLFLRACGYRATRCVDDPEFGEWIEFEKRGVNVRIAGEALCEGSK